MRLAQLTKKRREADLISLINIVFLMLVFFLVASTLRPFALHDLSLAKLARGEAGIAARGYVIIRKDGTLRYRGQDITLSDLAARVSVAFAGSSGKPIAIVADHRTPAARLIDVANALQAAGFRDMKVVTRRAQ